MTTKDEALKQALDWITKAYVEICRVDDPRFNTLLNLAPVVIEKLSTSAALAEQKPYQQLSTHMESATNGRMRIDPVTGDVSIGALKE